MITNPSPSQASTILASSSKSGESVDFGLSLNLYSVGATICAPIFKASLASSAFLISASINKSGYFSFISGISS